MAASTFDEMTAHRWFAVELNNRTWDFLESPASDPPIEVADAMIHAAHASCYHWLQVGNHANHARAQCLIANVYARLGLGDAALRHARRCVELTQTHREQMADWDFAFAYDCLARAHAAAGQQNDATRAKQLARESGDAIAEPEDRKEFDRWFHAREWHGLA